MTTVELLARIAEIVLACRGEALELCGDGERQSRLQSRRTYLEDEDNTIDSDASFVRSLRIVPKPR